MADRRIILVIGNSAACHWLRVSLTNIAPFPITVIVEKGGEGWRFYWKKLKKVGILTAIFQWKLNREYKARIAKELTYVDNPIRFHGVGHLEDWHETYILPGDLFFCFGTTIIPAYTLKRLRSHGAEIVNLHTGYLPYYRGVKSEFWAIKNRQRKYIGATIHQMTAKLDGGEIWKRWVIDTNTKDPITARIELMRESLSHILQFMDDWRMGIMPWAIPKDHKGKYYTTPTRKEWNEVVDRK